MDSSSLSRELNAGPIMTSSSQVLVKLIICIVEPMLLSQLDGNACARLLPTT